MLQEIKDKYQHLVKSSSHMWANGNFSFYRLGIFIASYKGQKRILHFIWKVIRYIYRKIFGIKPDRTPDYDLWQRKYFATPEVLEQYSIESKKLGYRPLVSVLLPVYNPSLDLLHTAIQSVKNQIYDNWELCISDDCSTDPNVKSTLDIIIASDSRIKVFYRAEYGDISLSSNSALSMATGGFITFLNQNDFLSPDALLHHVHILNENIELDLIYSDEDKVDEHGKHFDPHFKPDWCPDNFLSRNYLGQPVLIRKSLVDKIGGFRSGFEGNQDYDLLLRITELTKRIHHIPLVLYHRRMNLSEASVNDETKLYDSNAGVKALQEALGRRHIAGSVKLIDNLPGLYSIRYNIIDPGKVSVIIPTKNKHDLCEVIVDSVFRLTDFPDFEVILIDNNSDEQEFFDFVKKWEQKEPARFKCIKDSGPFNFSRLMNNGVAHSNGKYLLLLNNDTEVLHADWMRAMVEQCQFATTGAVGVKLMYHNNTIQHAGVIIGIGGIAGHTFVGYDREAAGYFNFLKCISNYSAVTAACVMVKKKDYLDVGGFEEALAVEFNDVDFCLKLKEKGLNNIYLPHVQLYHYESISRGHPHQTRESYKQHLSDMSFFEQRWKKYIVHDPCYSPHLTRLFTNFSIRVKELL